MKKIDSDHFPSGKWKKLILLMKLSVVILLCSVGTLAASPVYSQSKRFDVTYQKTSLISVLNDLQTKTGYYFVYFDGVVPENVSVTTSLKSASLEQVLEEVLTKNGLTYKIGESVIGIGKADATVQQQPAALKVTGTVRDSGKSPVAGASVLIQGTTKGAITDANGRFELSVPAGHHILEISYIGMVSQSVDITGKTDVAIVLAQKDYAVDDVVITGIFTKAKESYTGAVTTITKEDLKAAGNRNVLASIQNIDPSFNIIQDMEFGSDPNRLPDITLRGRTSMDANVRDIQEESTSQSTANQPLFILDGFEISLQRVIDMDPEQIETITLLKDASATAMYGARGANGIVVITTRRPEPGRLRVAYRGSLTIEAPDLSSYNLMNAREKLAYEKAAGLYNGATDDGVQTMQELYNQRLIEVERGVDTYWLKYPIRTGVGHRHSLTLDGGADNFRYAVGLGYKNVAGAMKESARNTFSGNVFFQYELKNIKFQNDLTILYNKNFNSPYGSFSEFAAANPIYAPYDADGHLRKILAQPPTGGGVPPQAGNPLFNAMQPYRDDGSYTNIQNNFGIEWHITPDLFVRGRLGITKQDSRTDKYLSREHTSFDTDAYSGENFKLRGSYTYGTAYLFNYESDLTLNYNKTFADRHQLYAGLSLSMGEDRSETLSFTANGLSALNMANIGLAGGYPPEAKPVTTEGHSRRFGTTLNVNYTFDRRYFVDLSGKMEGSSKFGANNRIAPFWSAGAGWNLHNESFLRDIEAINSLRLRVSYGTTGLQHFDPYQAMTTYRYFLNQSYKYWNGSYMIAMGNPALSWQKTNQTNIGVEMMLFNSRLNLSVDLYNKLTESLLTDINLPTAAGFESYKANVGEVRNRGFEVNANAFIFRNTGGFSWSVGGTVLHNKNRIMKISNSLDFLNQELIEDAGPNPSFLYREGESMNTIYVVRSLGIDPATGNEVFLDRNGKRTYDWNAQDKVACGVKDPKLWGNLRTMLRWKNLSFNATFSYTLGGNIYNQTLIDKVENISTSRPGVNNPWNNVDRRALTDRWQTPGDDAYFKRITDFNATNASSRFVMKENTLQLKSVSLTYEFDRDWLQKNLGGLEYLTVSFYGEDLFYLSTIKRERGTTYPFARQFSLSISTRF